jgi:hypothetical protein
VNTLDIQTVKLWQDVYDVARYCRQNYGTFSVQNYWDYLWDFINNLVWYDVVALTTIYIDDMCAQWFTNSKELVEHITTHSLTSASCWAVLNVNQVDIPKYTNVIKKVW